MSQRVVLWKASCEQRGHSDIFPTCKIMQKVNTPAEGYKHHTRTWPPPSCPLSQSRPTLAFSKPDWTRVLQGSLSLGFPPVDHETTSMTPIVHWVRLCRLGGQCSYIYIKNKMQRMCVNREASSTRLYTAAQLRLSAPEQAVAGLISVSISNISG